MSKYAIRGGHEYTGADGGAVGYVNEIDVNRRYYKKVIEKLQALGHEVLDVTPPEANRSLADSLNYGIDRANEWGADYFISCHVNAYQYVECAMGCEVVVGSQRGFDLGSNVVNELVNLGFKSRGAKYDTRGLAEIRGTNMVALIIEPFFCDSKADVDLYNKVGDDGIASAIIKGLTGQTVDSQPSQPIIQPIPQSQSQGNEWVRSIQRLCNQLGIKGANGLQLLEDNLYGQNTDYACRQLPIARINNYHNDLYTRWIQTRLGISVDGIFYTECDRVVRRWQNEHGLDDDGQVGINTLKSMLGV